jgi:TolA-binding protein
MMANFIREHVLKFLCGSLCIACVCALSACKTTPQPVKNGLAYFNTYYNANRLMVETEDEFFLYDEAHRTTPRIIVIDEPTLVDDKPDNREVPQFIKTLVVKPEKLDRARVWVDSVIIKGSKILSRHAQSDLIDWTLYLMAKAYFYKSEWHDAQMKCQELIDNYPYSPLSPDAHLLLAETLLLQTKFTQAEKALLRTIDVAWGQRRYDALSEAFRIQAELAMHFDNLDDAVKPYRRAIAQADDRVQQSRWQLEIGLLFYRKRQFHDALAELAKVSQFSPDALTKFEAELYTAAALTHLGEFDKAKKAFDALLSNRNYAEWRAFAYGEYISFLRLSSRQGIDSVYAMIDTLGFKEPSATARYRQALALFKEDQYEGAQILFSKSLIETMPAFFYGSLYARLLADWKIYAPEAQNSVAFYRLLREDSTTYFSPSQDSARRLAAFSIYKFGRIHERLGKPDSALPYYQAAAAICPEADTNRARYLYAEAAIAGLDAQGAEAVGKKRLSRKRSSEYIDSLLSEIVALYPQTQQGIDARIRLGYTEQFSPDAIADIMKSADRFRQIKQFPQAVRKYKTVAEKYPDSKHAPRAMYAQAWLYEKELRQRDSALYWYKTLLERYPQSPFARDIQPSFLAMEEERAAQDSLQRSSNGAISDSSAARLQRYNLEQNASAGSTNATVQSSSVQPIRRRK